MKALWQGAVRNRQEAPVECATGLLGAGTGSAGAGLEDLVCRGPSLCRWWVAGGLALTCTCFLRGALAAPTLGLR